MYQQTPQGNTKDHIPGALRTFNNITQHWQLTPEESARLLGTPVSTFYRWRRQPEKASMDQDKLERLSYVFGIFKALRLIYSDESVADGWLDRPNSNPLFGGEPPRRRLLHGQVADLFQIRQHLDARRGVI